MSNQGIEWHGDQVPRRNAPCILYVKNQDPISPAVRREPPQPTVEEIYRRSIEEMFFEWNPYDDLKDAYLDFDMKRLRLTLQVSGKRMDITKNDIAWLVI